MIEGATVPQGYPRAVRVAAFVKGGGGRVFVDTVHPGTRY